MTILALATIDTAWTGFPTVNSVDERNRHHWESHDYSLSANEEYRLSLVYHVPIVTLLCRIGICVDNMPHMCIQFRFESSQLVGHRHVHYIWRDCGNRICVGRVSKILIIWSTFLLIPLLY